MACGFALTAGPAAHCLKSKPCEAFAPHGFSVFDLGLLDSEVGCNQDSQLSPKRFLMASA
jgi:hypothetical protein